MSPCMALQPNTHGRKGVQGRHGGSIVVQRGLGLLVLALRVVVVRRQEVRLVSR